MAGAACMRRKRLYTLPRVALLYKAFAQTVVSLRVWAVRFGKMSFVGGELGGYSD